jgi:alkylated DNA repair protein (DNA oxidative demethylase)
MTDLFAALPAGPARTLRPGVVLLPRFAPIEAVDAAVGAVTAEAPPRHFATPGGKAMSVAMTNCGPLGWVSDRAGYRYQPTDPATGRPWPAMPAAFRDLAARAADTAGFPGFAPDACLVNLYVPGTRLTLHQDRDERAFGDPIVSVSLGLPAVFLMGGERRSDPTEPLRLEDGDVLVFGGPARLMFHGVKPLADGIHPRTGARRINLTFRRAG